MLNDTKNGPVAGGTAGQGLGNTNQPNCTRSPWSVLLLARQHLEDSDGWAGSDERLAGMLIDRLSRALEHGDDLRISFFGRSLQRLLDRLLAAQQCQEDATECLHMRPASSKTVPPRHWAHKSPLPRASASKHSPFPRGGVDRGKSSWGAGWFDGRPAARRSRNDREAKYE